MIITNPAKKRQRVERAILGEDGIIYLVKMANVVFAHQSLNKNSNEMAKGPFERKWRWKMKMANMAKICQNLNYMSIRMV